MDQSRQPLSGRKCAVRIIVGVLLAYTVAFLLPQWSLVVLLTFVAFAAWQVWMYTSGRRASRYATD
jgi:hypothetical protein